MKETGEIKSMFDKIVQRYDFLNRLFSFWQDIIWRKKMATEAVKDGAQIVLDLAVGTGDSAKELVKKDIKVIGVDISFEMIRVAINKIESNFVAVSASAYQLPFKEQSFDAVTCAFGIRNMHDTEKALKEINRIIKKGGKIVILEFSLPKGYLKKPYLLYLKKFIPLVASFFSVRSAYEYLGSSIEGFCKPDDFIKLLEHCGFKNIKALPLSFGVVYLYVGEKF